MNERQHFVPEYKGGGVKKTYASLEEAQAAADHVRSLGRPLVQAYQCSVCDQYHLGNRRLTDEEWDAEQTRRAAVREARFQRSQHFRYGPWTGKGDEVKTTYSTLTEAEIAARSRPAEDQPVCAYQCLMCGLFHIGRSKREERS